MSLDFAVSERQAFGTSYQAATVKKLLAGRLTMTPHPEWQLPETIDWAADPFDDVNWQNQYHMLRWLDPLRRAAAQGDDDAFAMWLRYVKDWVRSNPREKPAHEWVWRDMVEGIRVIQFCLAAPLIRDRSPEDLGWLEATIRDHAEFMADPANLGKANHAMHQHEALFVCGRILRDETFTELAISRFDQLLNEEYDEQGVNGEGAVAYHYNNYLWYERALKRFDVEGVPRPSAAARHARAPEEIAHATRPDGTLVPIGDTDGGSARNVNSPYTDYVTTGGAEGEPPADLLKIYDRGYLFARSGWGETEKNLDQETFFSVSFGKSDRVHGHPDGGSLTFSADTVNWIVDPGKFQYGYSIPRKHFVSRTAHSLASIEGRTPRKGAAVELTRRTVTDRAYDFLFSDNSFAGVSLTRRVIYSTHGDYLVIVDHVRSNQPVTAIQRWQLGPGVDAEISRHRAELTSGSHKAALSFVGTATQLSQLRAQNSPFDGWVATGWKQKTEATVVNASKSGTNFRFITVLGAGTGAYPTATTVPATVPGFCLQVSTGRLNEYIVVEREGVWFPDEPPTEEIEPAGGEAHPVKPTVSGRAHHLDPRSRGEVFRLLTEARRSATEMPPARRAELAADLQKEALERGLTGDIDLGVTAAVTDLQQTVRGRVDPKKIEPHRTALVNWSSDSLWRPTFYPMPLLHHAETFRLTERPTEAEIHTVQLGPQVLPLALDPAPGSTLTVLFQGAMDRGRIRLPLFLRWRHQTEMNAGPTLAVADPTLDLASSMRLGWYLGTERQEIVPSIAGIIQQIAESIGAAQVVLVGSSGGGFAALQVGSHLPDSTVVAMSPQSDLRDYSPRLVALAIEPALGIRRLEDLNVEDARISVPERFAARKTYPRVHLLSNSGDVLHVTNHEKPLRNAYEAAGLSHRFSTSSVDLGPGHRSVDNETYSDVMRRVYDEL
ncbi:heparinase II/III family protein [Brachybacterium sp. GCM10030267]|uniref:heparinase II/III domain-containing protein n=1 Tax=Brachybacterium sp. GCM10030267 TaxID=3273381 RepID=UPI00361AF045